MFFFFISPYYIIIFISSPPPPPPPSPLLRCVLLTNEIPASKEVGGYCARINGCQHGGYRWNHLYLNRNNIIPSLLENLKLDLAVLTLLSVGQYDKIGALGFAVLCVGQFFLRYFGNFNLELRYSPNLRDSVFWHFGRYDKFSFKSSNVFRAFSSFRSFHFLLIINQHATGCYLFCLNRTFPNINEFMLHCNFRVICSKLNVQCSGFSMASSFDTLL